MQKPAPVHISSYKPRLKMYKKDKKKELNSSVKQTLSLVSNPKGGAGPAGPGRGGCRESLGEEGTKRGEILEVQSLLQSREKQGVFFVENRRGFVSFLVAGKADLSPAAAGFHHGGSLEEGTWGHWQGLALRGALEGTAKYLQK